MFRISIGISLMVSALVVAVVIVAAGPGSADMCSGQGSICIIACFDVCDKEPAETKGACLSQCSSDCYSQIDKCREGRGPNSGTAPTNFGGTPLPEPTGPPSKGIGGLNPVTGVIQTPVEGGGTKPPPKPPIGVRPVIPVNPTNPVTVEQPPGNTGSGVTILEKGGGGTTTGSNLPGAGSGVSNNQTQELIKSWQQKVNDKNSVLYKGQTPGGTGTVSPNVKSQIFNQSNQTSALGGSGKQKLQNEMLHLDKETSNVQNFSAPAASHVHGHK